MKCASYVTAWGWDSGSCLRSVSGKQLEKLDVLRELYLLINALEKNPDYAYDRHIGTLLRLVNCVLISEKT